MAEHQKISQTLEKLFNSKYFSKPGVYKELLSYLVNASLKGEVPKEQQIASDVFGKGHQADKEINVRVYILNLRQKLEDYYLNEGKDDSLILRIPKGKYQVEFKLIRSKYYKRLLSKFGIWVFVSGVFLFLISIFIFTYSENFRKPKHLIWGGFMNPDYPILIILGDHYFFNNQTATGRMGPSRDTRINSEEDLDNLLKKYPELFGKITKSKTTYINNQAPIGLFNIMKLFGGGLANIDMKYSSQLRWEDTKNKHLIFIGSVKTLRFLDQTIERAGIKYDLEQSSFLYSTEDSTFHYNNLPGIYLNREYSILIHFATHDGRKVLFLLSDADVGNIAAMKILTDPDNKKFQERLLQDGKNLNFKAVFEIKGLENTEFGIELIRTDIIKENISDIWP